VITFDRHGLEREGFSGFVPVSRLSGARGVDVPPRDPGVYVLVRAGTEKPQFIDPGTGGWFKGTDPNVRTTVLEANWVHAASVVYIGMASSLKARLSQLIRFGRGRNVGHKGGRYLWQLADSEDLLVAWQVDADPVARESELLKAFVAEHGALPYANLRW
jgi:hypothetical protein